jgi:3D-(3,5/4)-trihydroxycyclohexane-1,2-dione acylhydrolase (decyclizing)
VTLTVAQALIRFLAVQEVERDGVRRRFFAGCAGVFGHGNVGGLGEALLAERSELPFLPCRNEQSMVHLATGFARQSNRLRAFACTSSIGPGATNMVTGAALATVNRIPVLLLPADAFAVRSPRPVLQQLEAPGEPAATANDALRAVSRHFDRLARPEELASACLEAMRVLVDPAETGAVTLALPQDLQTETVEVPRSFLEPRVWRIPRCPPDPDAVARAAELVRSARRPLLVAGGGVIYSGASGALRRLAERCEIPVAETQAGHGAMRFDHPLAARAIGVSGTLAANRLAREADLVIGVGTRWSDFTTASTTAFRDPGVRFVNLNVSGFDAAKNAALPVLGDARAGLDLLSDALAGHAVEAEWGERVADEIRAGRARAEEVRARGGRGARLTQAEVIAAVNDVAGEEGVVVAAAGSLPGELHKLWRARHEKSYHVEYGYSCMGYEIPAAIGARLAEPDRPVFAMVGDGSYLMLPGELVTAVAERIGVVIVIVQNHGYASIGALSRSLGLDGFGTHHRYRDGPDPVLDRHGDEVATAPDADPLPVDLAANAASLGARVARVARRSELRPALQSAVAVVDRPAVVHVEVDRYELTPDEESWWDVPVAAISARPGVRRARAAYERGAAERRTYLEAP